MRIYNTSICLLPYLLPRRPKTKIRKKLKTCKNFTAEMEAACDEQWECRSCWCVGEVAAIWNSSEKQINHTKVMIVKIRYCLSEELERKKSDGFQKAITQQSSELQKKRSTSINRYDIKSMEQIMEEIHIWIQWLVKAMKLYMEAVTYLLEIIIKKKVMYSRGSWMQNPQIVWWKR